MVHIPILRHGRPYRSLDVASLSHYRTREPLVEISQANVGLIRRDLLRQADARVALARRPVRELIDICGRAADHFMRDPLPLDPDGPLQTPDDYVRQLTGTTGLPHVLVRRNMQKIRGVLAEMAQVLDGLSRHLAPSIFDDGVAAAEGGALSFFPRGQSLGVVLPSNSPGVHTLWAPAVAMKVPLVLRPGSAEPWTPLRMAQALMRAGCPPEAFSYYPSAHGASGEILRGTGRGMLFGDASTTKAWRGNPRVELHGPGFSKIVIGEDCVDRWPEFLDTIVRSIVENGGRSCINASGVWTPRHGDAIADALAARLAGIVPRAEDDDRAELAPFADPSVARRISAIVDADLREPGAREVTSDQQPDGRLVTRDGCTYLLPTIVRCGPEHALANREFLFPFASVVEVPQAALPEALGQTLVVSAITEDPSLIRRLVDSPLVDRLNVGPIPTNRLTWDQPHEGNLFDHLYGRRAYQRLPVAV